MAEHLDAHKVATRSAHVLFLYLPRDFCHLGKIEFACQHHDIGKLRIELQCLDIADVELGREVHFLSDAAAVGHHGDVAGDDGGNARLMGSIYDGVHVVDVFAIDDGIDGEVGLDAMCLALGSDMLEVVDGKGVGGVGTHIELPDAEIHGIGASLYGGRERLPRPHGSHHLEIG